jgi:selenocysteine lyase/cysteine desulfurase
LLEAGVFGNPHSKNLTSMAMTELVEQARAAVLRFFNASPEEYTVIFTPNATGALKLVGEAYPFAPGDNYLLTFDNHNSVNGLREFARAKGATVTYLPTVPPDMRVEPDTLAAALPAAGRGRHNLLAYPAQSNFTGVLHPLEWIAQAQAGGWQVLLDAAAFAPTNRLDLGARGILTLWSSRFTSSWLFPRASAAGAHRRWRPAPPLVWRRHLTFSSVLGDGYHDLRRGRL